jgi:hypothetical protein
MSNNKEWYEVLGDLIKSVLKQIFGGGDKK